MIKAAFFDIDGTLLSFNTHKIPVEAKSALKKLRASGVKIFLATGRHYLEADRVIEDIVFDGYVTLNGQFCFDREGIIYQTPIRREDVQAMLDWVDEKSMPCMFVERDEMYINFINGDVTSFQQEIELPVPVVKDPKRALEHDIFQMIPYLDREQEKILMPRIPGCDAARWHPLFVDIVVRGGNKSIGIEKLIQKYGISPEETIAFGDADNDVEMLQYVGCGVAMGNAADSIKAVADYVTTSVDDGGIINALRHFGLV